MPSLRPLVLLAISLPALVIAGCAPAVAPERMHVFGGEYTGRVTEDGEAFVTRIALPELASGSFTFTGVTPEGETFTGTGTYDHPRITMTFQIPSLGHPDTATGTVSDARDAITLTFREPGQPNHTLIFRRTDGS